MVEILPRLDYRHVDLAVITRENTPIQDYIKLNEATNEQLIEELLKRLKGGKDE